MQTKSVIYLLPKPPLCIATPIRYILYSKQDFIKKTNQLNGIKRIFYSLYAMSNPEIDKIWFDMDSPQSYESVKRLINYCKNNNYKYSIVFSGGGFHFYIFSKNEEPLQSPKDVLAFLHNKIAQECDLIWGDSKEADLDAHCAGDIMRVVTLPGTKNIKRNKFAISLKMEEFEKGIDFIKELANTQRNEIYIYGDNLFNVDEFKDIKREVHCNNVEIPDFECRDEFNDEDIKKFPPCIQQCLLDINGKGDYRGRWITTMFLKDWGYEGPEINKIAKTYFGKIKRTDGNWTNYDHWRKVKVLDYIINKNVSMPSCDEMFIEGRCPGKCKFYQERGIKGLLKKIF